MTAEHDVKNFIFTVLNAVINIVIHYPNNLTGIILLKTWIYLTLKKIIQMWMMFIKWIYVTQDLQSIMSDTKEWFRFRRRDLVWEQVSSCSWYKPCGKEDERNFQSHVIVSAVQKLESKTVISVHSNEHSLVSCNKRPSEDQPVLECSNIISRSLNFSVLSSHVKNTQSHSDNSEFSY